MATPVQNENQPEKNSMASKAAWILIAGLGIGWMVGLSATPVIQGVITAILAVAVSAAGLLAGTEIKSKQDNQRRSILVNPLPIAALILGLAIGASIGVFARTHNWLGIDGEKAASSSKENHQQNVRYGALFTLSADEISRLRAVDEQHVKEVMLSMTDKRIKRFAESCNDTKVLIKAVRELICPDK